MHRLRVAARTPRPPLLGGLAIADADDHPEDDIVQVAQLVLNEGWYLCAHSSDGLAAQTVQLDNSGTLSMEIVLITREACLGNDVDAEGIEKTLSAEKVAGRTKHERITDHSGIKFLPPTPLHLLNQNLIFSTPLPRGPRQGG